MATARAVCPPENRSATQGMSNHSTLFRGELLQLSNGFALRSSGWKASRGFRRVGLGSGVTIAGDGLVLTNSHVVGGAKDVRL